MSDLSSPSNQIRVHVFISGTVQGVGYRWSTFDQARRLGINGWVRNLTDGRVEAVFEGTTDRIEQMIDWCHQGPSHAIVRDVTVEYEEVQGDRTFEIRKSNG